MVEQLPFKQRAVGSIPARLTMILKGFAVLSADPFLMSETLAILTYTPKNYINIKKNTLINLTRDVSVRIYQCR